MKKAKLIILLLLIWNSVLSQDTAATREAVTRIRISYNEKKFSEIYGLFSGSFKKQMTEKEFTDFIKTSVSDAYGIMESHELLKVNEDIFSFVCHHKYGDLLLNISLNYANQIKTLEFLPYKAVLKTKNSNYLSDNKLATSLDSLIDKVVKDYMQSPQNCGLSIGIIQNGNEYYYNYGEIQKDSKVIPTRESIYEIGSLTKTFCGVLLAVAIKENKVKASDDIRKYLPRADYDNLEVNGKPITLLHLANHTSGLPRIPEDLTVQTAYDPMNPYQNYSKEMVYKYLQMITLKAEPGKICDYSNLGMALLGIILEGVYQKNFESLVQEKICQQCDMTATVVKLTDEQNKLFVKGYNANGKETPYWDLGDLCAAGGLRSSPQDMLHFVKGNLEEKTEAFKLSHQPSFTDGNILGMAWHIMKTRQGNMLVWHNGGTFGFSSFCGFIREKNCGVVILSNSGTMVDPIALRIIAHLQK